MIPSAIVYVDQREKDEYSIIPSKSLKLHKPTEGPCEMRNLLIKDFSEDALVQVDDDLKGVRRAWNTKEIYRDPNIILGIIENGLAIAEDLNLGAFSWSRSPTMFTFKKLYQGDGFQKIFSFVAPVCATFIVRGPARMRKFDSTFAGRADVDFTFRCLLHDRIICAENRFYFDHGAAFSGRGGCVDLISGEQYDTITQLLKRKWGRYCTLTGKSMSTRRNSKATKDRMAFKQIRKSPFAVR